MPIIFMMCLKFAKKLRYSSSSCHQSFTLLVMLDSLYLACQVCRLYCQYKNVSHCRELVGQLKMLNIKKLWCDYSNIYSNVLFEYYENYSFSYKEDLIGYWLEATYLWHVEMLEVMKGYKLFDINILSTLLHKPSLMMTRLSFYFLGKGIE